MKTKQLLEKLWEKIESDSMDIYTEEGALVSYKGHEKVGVGFKFSEQDIFKNAKIYLEKNKIYTVKQTQPFSWLTIVELKEFPGVLFNSAHFINEKMPSAK